MREKFSKIKGDKKKLLENADRDVEECNE